MQKHWKQILTLGIALLLGGGAQAALPAQAEAQKTVAQWVEGYASGANWFGEGFAYDITDTQACWDLLTRPITVLDVGEREVVYPLKTPGGEKVNADKLGGSLAGATAAVHVLGADEDGWTLIEGMDDYDRLITGYVRTKLLKTVTPSQKAGVIIDKLTQRLYVFIDGQYFSSVPVSTGLANDAQPYNETSTGEYLISSWVGGFDSEGMYVEMGMRFNNGDLLHQVPYLTLADGTKQFDKFEKLLGQKASHGCVRVARIASPEGLNIRWLWENLKRNTKVVIWDDDGRRLPYPAADTALYYNPDGGRYYHADANCPTVKDRYLPLTAFSYGELDAAPYRDLEPCPGCAPPPRKEVIDAQNAARGLAPLDASADASAGDAGTGAAPQGSETPSSSDAAQDGEATQHPVEIQILPAAN